MLKYPHVALLMNDKAKARILEEQLREHVVLLKAESLRELQAHLEARQLDALLCDSRFDGGSWKIAMKKIKASHADVPVIVLSQGGGEKEWVEVIEAGAFDLLVPPYWKGVVLATLEHATASQEARQWQRMPLEPADAAPQG